MTQAAAIREMNKALAEIIREIDREIVKLAASLDTEGGALKADAFNLRNLVSMRQQMEEFADAKAPQLLREFRRNLPGIVEQVIAEYPDLGRFTPAIIEQLQDTFTDQITEMVQTLNKEVSDDLMRALRLSIVGSVEVPKMQANLAKSLAVSELRVQALIERSVRDFGDVAVKQAGKVRQEVTGETMYYLYLGPKDSKNRPFCAARVDRALTQEAADSMTGTQERYNCRHNLVPVTQEYVKKEKIPIYRGLA